MAERDPMARERWDHRRRPGHPWLFMLALGTMVAALCDGAVGVAMVMVFLIGWTLRA